MFSSKLNFKSNYFQCPHCQAYVRQKWYDVGKGLISEKELNYCEEFMPELHFSVCSKCGRYALWLFDRMIHPAWSVAPWPATGMPEKIKQDFLEAREIVSDSPKSACALLRICLQKLLTYFGLNGRHTDLASLNIIRDGRSQRLTDALWLVRAIGPGTAKPGELCPRDTLETAINLFQLVNLIVESKTSPNIEVSQFRVPSKKLVRRRRVRLRVVKKKREIIPTPTILYR
jgi:hypothetical protein